VTLTHGAVPRWPRWRGVQFEHHQPEEAGHPGHLIAGEADLCVGYRRFTRCRWRGAARYIGWRRALLF
jgi:hypothetical protein